MPELENAAATETTTLLRQRLRLRYKKDNVLKYIGHRDVLRFVMRMLRKAEVPTAMSGKFSPKPRLTFGPPCPLGSSAANELLDLELREGVEWSPEEIAASLKQLIKASAPRDFALGLTVLAPEQPAIAKSVRGYRYDICVPDQSVEALELLDAVTLYHTTPRGKLVDIKHSLLNAHELTETCLRVEGYAQGKYHFNVMHLAAYLKEHGLPVASIHREGLLDENGEQL